MAELLKNWFNADFVGRIAEALSEVNAGFDQKTFKHTVLDSEWEGRELKARMRHISHCLHTSLGGDFSENLKLITRVAPRFEGLTAMVFPDYVEVYGLDEPEISLDALELLTQFSSSEFAIRPFILQDQKKTMERMVLWAQHPNHHVRRFASEGCRPRLPWAVALPSLKADPEPILPILHHLKNDDSEYVRKSVANNINDISKDNEEVVLRLGQDWYGHNQHTDWIIKHGLRGLLKKGHPAALDIFGFNQNVDAEVMDLELSRNKVNIGESLQFSFSIRHHEPKEVFLKVGYQVAYVKASGKQSKKVFHVTENRFASEEVYTFSKKISFKDLTTRKHYPGTHEIFVLINGETFGSLQFEVE